MIPIIDVAALYTDDEQGWQKVVRAIDEACREVGFFYIKGHKIPFAEIERIFSIGQDFFALPEKEKLSIDITQSANHRGYGAFRL